MHSRQSLTRTLHLLSRV